MNYASPLVREDGRVSEAECVCWHETRPHDSRNGLKAMTNKVKTRKTKQKLLLNWAEDKAFAVNVTVRQRPSPRLLRPSTIAIHLGHPGVKQASIGRVGS